MRGFVCLLLCCLVGVLSGFAANRAMIVGIGDYDTERTGWSKIHGDKDVNLLVTGLIKNGYERKNIITLKNQEATKGAIVAGLKRLASLCKPGDNVFFHFSGHGQPVTDLNRDDKNGRKDFDEAIVPYDAYRSPRYMVGNRHYQAENHLIDDELNLLLNDIKVRIGRGGILFVSVDACFSQGIEMDDMTHLTPEEIAVVGPTRGTAQRFCISSSNYLKGLPKPSGFSKGGRLIVVSACKYNERNFEYRVPHTNLTYGSLSYYLSTLLNRDADFARWEKCFQNKQYQATGIIVDFQHPTITVYK